MKESPSLPPPGPEIDSRDEIVAAIFRRAEAIARRVVRQEKSLPPSLERQAGRYLSPPPGQGFPIMLLLLGVVFWLTLSGGQLSFPASGQPPLLG